jgi:glycerol kinase
MTVRYIAALDQGTSSTRCMVFDQHARMMSIAQREHRQYHPAPGHVEHDALEIWSVTQKVIVSALRQAGIDHTQVSALGITNQRETTVVWSRSTGIPVHRAIVWQDTRAGETLREITREMAASEIRRRTGLPLATYFSGPKLRWLFDNQPGLHGRADSGDLLFGTMDSWLVWNLTGGSHNPAAAHITDPTNASRTMLMRLDSLSWDDDLLAAMRARRSMLPEIRPTIGIGPTTVDPVPGIPIAAIIGDQQASLFGQTAFDAGDAKCTFGTGCFLLLNTGTELVHSTHGLITTVARTSAGEPTEYALEGSIATAGGLVRWCRDNLGLIRTPAEIETLAESVDDNGGCFVVPAFSGLFAPIWDPTAQGLIVGLTGYITKGHIARAVLESTAWQTKDLIDAMNIDVGVPARSLTVDGGMTTNNLLMQTVADILDVPVIRPITAETVALGAAYAAGLAVGIWPDREVLRHKWRRAADWTPKIDPARRDADLRRWRCAVSLARQWGALTTPTPSNF